MRKLGVGIVGMGFIGAAHLEAIRRLGDVEVVAVCGGDFQKTQQRAKELYIPKCYERVEDLMADPAVEVIHNCTPNHLHSLVNILAIKAGKHVFSEKPLARNAQESGEMVALLKQHPRVVAGVNFCYRMNPLLQDAKQRIAQGEIGAPYLVHGSFLQDWLLFDTDYNWRIDPEYTGVSRCVADIGSHWMDTAQTLLGARIVEVCANTVTALPTRKKPVGHVATFAVNQSAAYEEREITTEDYAGVLVRFDNGTSGVFQCSEISAGRKCWLDIEVDGSLASFQWQLEHSEYLWKGNRDRGNEQIMRNPNLMTPQGSQYTYLPAGHPEGWSEGLKSNLAAFYGFIRSGKRLDTDVPDFATFEEGHYIMKITEAIITSGKTRQWVSV